MSRVVRDMSGGDPALVRRTMTDLVLEDCDPPPRSSSVGWGLGVPGLSSVLYLRPEVQNDTLRPGCLIEETRTKEETLYPFTRDGSFD